MSNVLIVSPNRRYREECKSTLRKAGYEAIAREDIIEGMKELRWLDPALIIWDFDSKQPMNMRALPVLRRQYQWIRLLLILSDNDSRDELKKMSDKILSNRARASTLVSKVNELIGRQSQDSVAFGIEAIKFKDRILDDYLCYP
jgi:DNA-binding response OmpR family regulator